MRKNQPGCPCCGSNSCFSLQCGLNLPKTDLTLNWTSYFGGVECGTAGSVNLRYNGGSAWTSDMWQTGSNPVGRCGSWYATLVCVNKQLILNYYDVSGLLICTSSFCRPYGAGYPGCLPLTSFSQNPLSISWNNNFVLGSGYPCDQILGSNIQSITITGPQPQATPPGTYCCVTVSTAICGLVAPGTITVTVRKNNAGGAVVCSGTATANGFFICAIPAPGLYYFSASTTAGGYSNQPITVNIQNSKGGPCNGTGIVFSPIVPTTVTASGFWGSVTLRPGLLDPYYNPVQPGNSCTTGSAANIYIGTTSYTYPAACQCGGGTISMDFVWIMCGAAGRLYPCLAWCFPATQNQTFLYLCPGNGPGQQTLTSTLLQCSGTGPEGSGRTGYPINLAGSESRSGTQTDFASPQCVLYGCCNTQQTTCTTNFAVTQ
jgi:hypothetical protein